MEEPQSRTSQTDRVAPGRERNRGATAYRAEPSWLSPEGSLWVYALIVLSLGAVFVTDLYTPLGVAVWIVYLIPSVLSFATWRPFLPPLVAVASSCLILTALVSESAGENIRDLARLNRGLGGITIWALAIIGYYFVRNKVYVRRQEWLQRGQTELSKAMGGDQPVEQLGRSILQFLAEYLGAHAGVLFSSDGGEYRRVADYGLPVDSGVPVAFKLGEGLLGQAAQDGRTFLLQSLPEDFFVVGSALGRGKPRELLIAPSVSDGKANAVIELGFMDRPHQSPVELLERLSESISIAVRSAHYRTHLQDLLEETQRQAEELQAQGEELRVSNEELEEQSRALKASQDRLEQQQTELEQTNAQLEEQTQLLEVQRDDLARAKEELQQRARELEQASRYKSDFLANMSHELRTPLNSSLILAKLLADNPHGNLTEEQVQYAETIRTSGNDLLALINDILDLSKIEAGRLEVLPGTQKIDQLLEDLRLSFEPIARRKRLELRLVREPGCPETIETDRQRLDQVLKNLVSNALKFTEHGEVRVEVAPVAEGRIRISVVDTGIGIAGDQLEVIFEAFRQADGTLSRRFGGTGLGLSISKQLVALLHGELHVESAPGKGSTFSVELPVEFEGAGQSRGEERFAALPPVQPEARTPATMPRTSERPRLAAPRGIEDDREKLTGNSRVILIVEDDREFARILCDLAHELNFQCLVATTAEEARVIALQYLPHAVVLDIGLPDHTGLSVLDGLKHDPRTRHIPVHVVSASDYTRTALTLGAVGYMLKPVKRDELVQALRQLEVRLTHRMRRVLVVEDDSVQLDSLMKLLDSRDVETVGVGTAADCLERLKEETFDCMVLDLSLPDASGYSVLETLSNEEAYSFPPVIVYTGRELGANEEQRLRRYSHSIIIKGAKSPERLLDEVTLFLHQVVSELPPEQQKMLEKARSRDAALEGRRILIVEDDVRNVFALTSIFEPRGAEVQIARNGREALEALETSLQKPDGAIDLVLMDIMMPEMDGLTATREIRKRHEWRRVPIIALTAKAMQDDQERCLEAGANDYMAKPLDVERLLSLVRVWMPR